MILWRRTKVKVPTLCQDIIMKRVYLKFKMWMARKRSNSVIFIFCFGAAIFVWREGLISTKVDAVKNTEIDLVPAVASLIHDRSSSDSVNDTYSRRRLQTAAACKSKKGAVWPPPINKVPRFKDSPLISKKFKLTFCPVGKVASSFFTRYMMFMESNGTISSPYDIPIENAAREKVSSLRSLNKTSAVLSFLNNSTKLVFGRDPYSRILSAYVDKLFSPNPFYWKHWGEKSLKLDRVKKMGTPCASDVTFSQFVRLVVLDLKRADVHLAPVSAVCNMCSVIYDVIGQLETVGKDLDYLQETKKIPSSFQYAPGYKFAASMDAVRDSVKSAFAWKKDIQKCISLDQMGMRIWRKLQLRGIVESRIKYPFKAGEMENMSVDAFISACQTAIQASTDQGQLKKQKKQVLQEAYSSVSKQLLQTIASTYKDDFDMFGYDPAPAKIFNNLESVKKTGYLEWDKPWIL